MRNEKEMMDLIIKTAQEDDRIRAVYMNGSRTNPNAPKDIFQDYDVVYVVTDVTSFTQDEDWIRVFGELLMKQEPDKNDRLIGIQKDFEQSYGYLMLFKDGNRIDLQLQTKECMKERYLSDKLTIPLLDKDECLPPIPESTDIDYHVRRPDVHRFNGCCNNFWWCMQNVAKGIWRDELPYAKSMFECVIRNNLDEMVSWSIGTKTDFNVSSGKMGKYFKKYLPAAYWDMYQRTYSSANYDEMWDSVFAACDLFNSLAEDVAEALSFPVQKEDAENMMKYLKQVRTLPADATEVF